MAFDGIVTKAICSELNELCDAKITKIFQPNKNDVVLGLYFQGSNYALNICTDSQYYRLHLTTHSKPNPQVAPNFCMVLRKHLIGLHIKNIITNNLERVVTIEFEGFDDINDIVLKKLVIELMGKHCNIILLDDQNFIIDSLRHIHSENSTRVITPHVKYSYPTTDKVNFLDCSSFQEFRQLIYAQSPQIEYDNISKIISKTFNGISHSFIENALNYLGITEINDTSLEKIYAFTKDIVNRTDNLQLQFETFNDKDYALIPCDDYENLSLNFFIDDFYYNKETSEEFKSYRNSVLKLILVVLKKYKNRLLNINQKLKDCENKDTYKLYGELITANLYKFKNDNLSEITVENYYNNNAPITIPLNTRYNLSDNARLYFKKYNKLKNTLNIVGIQKKETLNELDYIESVVYELENAKTIQEVSDIFEEISENDIFKEQTDKYKIKHKTAKVKKSTLTKNKLVSFNPLKYTIDNFTLYVGRNNKENDYLTLKFAKKTDLWFHTKDIHGSHAILKLTGNIKPDNDVLIKCAEIVAYHSKARNSSNVPVDICEVKYVKKPNGAKPGMVIYSNNITLNVQPKES